MGPANRDIMVQSSDVRVVVDPKSALLRQRLAARLQRRSAEGRLQGDESRMRSRIVPVAKASPHDRLLRAARSTAPPLARSEALKQAFHGRTLRQHPDAQASAAERRRRPKLRSRSSTKRIRRCRIRSCDIQHLLALEGRASTSRFEAVPDEIAELFPEIASVTQDAGAPDRESHERNECAEPFAADGRADAGARTHRRIAGRDIDATARRSRRGAAAARARRFAESDDVGVRSNCNSLYIRFSYLRRWMAQLEEHRTRSADDLIASRVR